MEVNSTANTRADAFPDDRSRYRDEQHDDQLLHEFLRCTKALSTSEVREYRIGFRPGTDRN